MKNKVFVSSLDSPLGHAVSRAFYLSSAPPQKREDEEEEEKKEEGPSDPYLITGSLTTFSDHLPLAVSTGGSEPIPYNLNRKLPLFPSQPGPFVSTGDKKRDSARKEAIDKFSVYGSSPKWVNETQKFADRNALKAHLETCDIIVFDLLSQLDDASWAVQALFDSADTWEKPKTFIAISSIMTWAKTKVEGDDSEASITEDEFRRRKCHPNFKAHLAVEKNIIKCGKKPNLKTYVIASGLVYHAGDCIFHYIFKSAWHNAPATECYGDGSNILPVIYMDDLASIVVEVAESSPENKYLLALDDSKHSYFDIVKAISDAVGNGQVKKVPKENAFLNKDLEQSDFDMIMTNLRLDPGHTKEMSLEWKYETGLIENVQQLVQEYKDARGLSALRLVIHGPPLSGKTYFAQLIANHFGIHLIDSEQVVKNALARLERRVAGNLLPEEAEEEIEGDKELLGEIKEFAKNNNGKCPPEHISNFIRDVIKSVPCRNQGYILDGYLTTIEQAKEIFKPLEESRDNDLEVKPDFVISLQSTDEFIKYRVMKMPESVIVENNYTEDILTRRLEEFRAINTDENSILNFFDEIEVHPLIINVEKNDTKAVMDLVSKHVGPPHNYGPSVEKIMEIRHQEEEAKAKEAAGAEEERRNRQKEEVERHEKEVKEWNLQLEEVGRQEQEALEAQSIPLRNYLMKYIMPTLTSGLIEVCKAKPVDPIDYLAEFLFKHNPGNN